MLPFAVWSILQILEDFSVTDKSAEGRSVSNVLGPISGLQNTYFQMPANDNALQKGLQSIFNIHMFSIYYVYALVQQIALASKFSH